MRKYFSVKVVSCCDPDFWYADKIGETIEVKKTDWDGWGFVARNGSSVFRGDVKSIEVTSA